MANSSSYTNIADLQGPGGRGAFVGALREPLADGGGADVVFATLVETRLNLKEWVQDYLAHHRGTRIDNVLWQNARREGARNTRSRFRRTIEGLAASYNGNLKSMLAFNGARFREDPKGELFGRLTEARVAGVPVPNPKKAFMGRSVMEPKAQGEGGVRLCFVGAHFPVAKLAAALEDTAHDTLHGAKVALARSLRKVLRKASRRGVANDRTALFVQGDLNSRTVLRQELTENEYTISLDRTRGHKLGLAVDGSPDMASYGGGGALLITALCGGVAEAWNREHPQEQVRIGDCIVEVNGVRDDSARMLEELEREKVLQLRLHRKVTDVLLEVLRDDSMQAAIQHELGLPPGRWHEIAGYETVHDLPVTYKFLDHVACCSAASSGALSPSSSPKTPAGSRTFFQALQKQDGEAAGRLARAAAGAVAAPAAMEPMAEPPHTALTIGDIMSTQSGPKRVPSSFKDYAETDSPRASASAKRRGDDEVNPRVELYRRHLSNLGEEKLVSYGLVYKKHDFRAFRFPACADRVIFWAPDALADRLSFELPRGGYEVNHAQLGSDHRPVALEVVMRVAPEGTALRCSESLHPGESQQMRLVIEQSDEGEGGQAQNRDSDDEHSPEEVDSGEETSVVASSPGGANTREASRPRSSKSEPVILAPFSAEDAAARRRS